jgi:hypothetical protein
MKNNRGKFQSMVLGLLILFSGGLTACEDPMSIRLSGNLAGSDITGSKDLAPGETSPDQDGGNDVELCDSPSEPQVKICHIPEGNPSEKHVLCVGLKGAVEGHGVRLDNSGSGGHGGDYLGACKN